MEQQAAFVRRLASLAKETGKSIHLVAHMRKGDGKSIQGSDDVKGGGEITDLASTVWIIEANKKKQREVSKQTQDAELLMEPDLWIRNDKNRRGITGNKFAFWLHPQSLQALERDSSSPVEMVLPFLAKQSFTPDSMPEEDVSF